MKFFVFYFSLLVSSFYSAQMLKNEIGNFLSETPFFNEKFIKSVRLKSLNGTVSTKKELGAIKSSGKKNTYLFDKNGFLKCQYKTIIKSQKRDTNFLFYEYNIEGDLLVKRFSDSYGFYSYSYNYNEEGLKANQVYAREKNASKSKINFSLLEQYIIFEESYNYTNKDTSVTKTVMNSNGRPYQKEISYYNQLGYLTMVKTRLLINNKSSREEYSYNDKGLLKKIEYFKEGSEKPFKAIKYDYDQFANVTFIDEYKNQQRVIHKELLYNHSTFVLKTILSQDLVTNLITITKFKPEFYH